MAPIDLESSGGLGGTSESVYGPLAVLLVGFLREEVERFRSMMMDMEADMVRVIPCSKAMLQGTLQAALESEQSPYEQPPLGMRRMVVMSGMYGSEVMEVIGAYRDAGLPPTAWAAAVPNSWGRTVEDVHDHVWKDHSTMLAKQRDSDGDWQRQST